MKKILILALALSVTGCSTIQSAAERDAVTGQALDVGSTITGLALGAAESNPLGVAALGLKWWLYTHIKEAPIEKQPPMWNTYGAVGWGLTANNVCIIGSIVSGGAFGLVCPFVGLAAGVIKYNQPISEGTK